MCWFNGFTLINPHFCSSSRLEGDQNMYCFQNIHKPQWWFNDWPFSIICMTTALVRTLAVNDDVCSWSRMSRPDVVRPLEPYGGWTPSLNGEWAGLLVLISCWSGLRGSLSSIKPDHTSKSHKIRPLTSALPCIVRAFFRLAARQRMHPEGTQPSNVLKDSLPSCVTNDLQSFISQCFRCSVYTIPLDMCISAAGWQSWVLLHFAELDNLTYFPKNVPTTFWHTCTVFSLHWFYINKKNL